MGGELQRVRRKRQDAVPGSLREEPRLGEGRPAVRGGVLTRAGEGPSAGRLRKSAILAALALSLLLACREKFGPGGEPGHLPATRAQEAGYALLPAERKAIDLFLERNRELRVARDSDRREGEDNESEVGNLYGVYHPYFVRGDLNDDGVLDFVLAFVRRESDRETPWFTVVVFSGRERPGGGTEFGPGAFLEKDTSLAHGDLAIDRDAVLITPDLAEEMTRRYRWDPARRSYIFVREGEKDEVESQELRVES